MLATSFCIVDLLPSCGACFCKPYAYRGPGQNPLGTYCEVGTNNGCARNHRKLGIPSLKPFGGPFGLKEMTIFEGHRRNLQSLKQGCPILLAFWCNLVIIQDVDAILKYNRGSAQSVVIFSRTVLVQTFIKSLNTCQKKLWMKLPCTT